MAVRRDDDPKFYAALEEKNLTRQYDLLVNCIEIGLKKGIEAFDKYTLWSLNSAAVANLSQFGGRYRRSPIYVGEHIPPPFWEVPDLMDRCISRVHEAWSGTDRTMGLPAYVLWRINWIHPFVEGNGRTARAACYYLICMAYGNLLPGKNTVPMRIKARPEPYHDALKAADRAWADGHLDVSQMEKYLGHLVLEQLSE